MRTTCEAAAVYWRSRQGVVFRAVPIMATFEVGGREFGFPTSAPPSWLVQGSDEPYATAMTGEAYAEWRRIREHAPVE